MQVTTVITEDPEYTCNWYCHTILLRWFITSKNISQIKLYLTSDLGSGKWFTIFPIMADHANIFIQHTKRLHHWHDNRSRGLGQPVQHFYGFVHTFHQLKKNSPQSRFLRNRAGVQTLLPSPQYQKISLTRKSKAGRDVGFM